MEKKILLNTDNTTQYLFKQNLLDPRSIVDGDLVVKDASRKNRNIQVLRKYAMSYLLKQPHLTDNYSIETLRSEAQIYRLAQTDPDFISLKGILPRILGFDNMQEILIIELITHGQSLANFIHTRQINGDSVPKELAALLGKSMATYL